MKLTEPEFRKLRDFAFSAENRGYRPDVVESPHGDGVWDTAKRYAHVAPKYGLGDCVEIYRELVLSAQRTSRALGIPEAFCPSLRGDCTIRVLDYPPGATSAPHTDFDLFTMCLYRDVDAFRYLDGKCDALNKARSISPGIHFGELLTEIMGWPATKHEVIPTDQRQSSAVLFVMPPLSAGLPSGLTVGDWLEERKGRSRKAAE